MRHAKFILVLACWLTTMLSVRAGATNTLAWNTASDQVSADVRGEALWPLLEDIAHQTGWHIFVEPGIDRRTDTKFKDLPRGEALKKLLGELNFAFVPQTNGPSLLYVFATVMRNATRQVAAAVGLGKTNTPGKHVPNELLVKVKPGTDIEALAKALGAKIVGRDDKLGLYRLQFEDAAATDAALEKLKSNPDVEAVDYNYLYDAPIAPQPVANSPMTPVSLQLDASKVGDPCNPIVGLIDTGVQSLGSQLDQFIMKPISVAGSSTDASGTTRAQSLDIKIQPISPMQSSVTGNSIGGTPTHGTAMAETILRAVSQQGSSSAVRILPVDVYGSSETATTWNVALGVKAAVDGGATVLNMSLGGTSDSAILDSIIRQALDKGVIIFAAAGNQPVDTPTYPAAISGVNAVTALGSPGQLADYANYGNFVDMALPGASMVYLGSQAYVVQGTSPATAYASGVAAGFKGVNCDTWQQIQAMMQQRFPVPYK